MPNNTQSPMSGQTPALDTVMSLLAAIVMRGGHSLSWYTSKKRRVWVTLKGTYPTTYTTSTEGDEHASASQLEQAFQVLICEHVRKMRGETPPLTTWLTRMAVEQLAESARAYALDLYARWQAGELFWYEGEQDNTPLHIVEPLSPD